MPGIHIEPLGEAIYSGGPFGKEMTSHYYPLENMQASVDFLKQRTDIDIRVMEYGQYQPLLAPMAVAGKKGPKFWWTECGFARIQLSNQANTQPLCNDEPSVVPLTRCGLLDACVRKCFNS